MGASKRRPVHQRLRRGAYLLPSLFTIGNIFCGFYAILLGIRGQFLLAALLIFIAAFIDALDGRIARLTGTESDFGREYDSLADVVTFGVAPALLAYLWGLQELGRIGWLIPLFYTVCTATRLARFNVHNDMLDKRYFVGLPAPAAAGTLASLLFAAPERGGRTVEGAFLIVALAAIGLLMVSNFRYYSFKELDLKRRWSYRIALLLAMVILMIALHPVVFLLAVSAGYVVSGPLLWIRGRLRRPHSDRQILSRPEELP